MGFPGGSDGEESACNAGDLGSVPGSGRYSGEGNGYPLQYSCQENSMDRGTLAGNTVHVTESDATEELTLSLYQIVCMFQAWCRRLKEGLELSPTSLRNCTVLLRHLSCLGAK